MKQESGPNYEVLPKKFVAFKRESRYHGMVWYGRIQYGGLGLSKFFFFFCFVYGLSSQAPSPVAFRQRSVAQFVFALFFLRLGFGDCI